MKVTFKAVDSGDKLRKLRKAREPIVVAHLVILEHGRLRQEDCMSVKPLLWPMQFQVCPDGG